MEPQAARCEVLAKRQALSPAVAACGRIVGQAILPASRISIRLSRRQAAVPWSVRISFSDRDIANFASAYSVWLSKPKTMTELL